MHSPFRCACPDNVAGSSRELASRIPLGQVVVFTMLLVPFPLLNVNMFCNFRLCGIEFCPSRFCTSGLLEGHHSDPAVVRPAPSWEPVPASEAMVLGGDTRPCTSGTLRICRHVRAQSTVFVFSVSQPAALVLSNINSHTSANVSLWADAA